MKKVNMLSKSKGERRKTQLKSDITFNIFDLYPKNLSQ